MGQQFFPLVFHWAAGWHTNDYSKQSIKALNLLMRLFIQSCTGSLLILGSMGHWKILDRKVFMRRYAQWRGAWVQMLFSYLQYADI